MAYKAKSVFGIFIEIVTWVFLSAIGVLVVFTIASNTAVFGGYKSFLVQSGSMEPAIMTGDIIIIRKQTAYATRDVITFQNKDYGVVTHRIVRVSEENGEELYETKGDANRTDDSGSTNQENVQGKVVFVVPKLGYFVAFAQSLPGLIILILIPAGILILSELKSLVTEGFGTGRRTT